MAEGEASLWPCDPLAIILSELFADIQFGPRCTLALG